MEEFLADKAEMCGGGPVVAAMMISAAMGADSSKIIKYANSGDVSGDRSAVVGYLSAAFYKK
jgi:AmmeMemoRadiSam system protein B